MSDLIFKTGGTEIEKTKQEKDMKNVLLFWRRTEMMELNKNSFFFYVLKQGGGKIDPRNIEFMIEALKEWLPTERVENKYDADYNAGWNDCLDVLRKNLK